MEDIEIWGQEIEAIHVKRALFETKKLCHPIDIRMTKQDIREINAYHAAIENFVVELKKQIT